LIDTGIQKNLFLWEFLRPYPLIL